MDQLISVLGDEAGALLIDCRTQQTRLVPFADPSVSLLIANSNVRHSLGDGAYAARMSACVEAAHKLGVAELGQATVATVAAAEQKLGPLLFRRARHVVTENARTRTAADALAGGDWRRGGRADVREPPVAARRLRGQRPRARHAGRAGVATSASRAASTARA